MGSIAPSLLPTPLLAMLPLTLQRSPPTATTMLLLTTTQGLPSARQSPMMALELWRDPTLSTFLMAVSRLSTITPMTMMDSSLMSPTREHPPTLLLPLLLLTLLLPLLLTLSALLLTLWLPPLLTLLLPPLPILLLPPLLIPLLLVLLILFLLQLLTHSLPLFLSLLDELPPLSLVNFYFQQNIFIIFMKYR